MIEFWDYLSQFLAVTAGFCAALSAFTGAAFLTEAAGLVLFSLGGGVSFIGEIEGFGLSGCAMDF